MKYGLIIAGLIILLLIISAGCLVLTQTPQISVVELDFLKLDFDWPHNSVPGVLIIGTAHAQSPTVDYYKWIGPTVNGTPSATMIDNTGYNMIIQALFGGDARNASLTKFDPEGIIGGLAWPYNAVPGILLVIIGFVLGIIMFIKLDGDLLIPGGILMLTGILSGGSNLAFAVPWEMILFSTLAVVLGLSAIIIQLVIGRGD